MNSEAGIEEDTIFYARWKEISVDGAGIVESDEENPKTLDGIERDKYKMDALLKRVDTFFGTQEEIRQLLQNCGLPITMTSELFNKYPNLKVIVEKNAGDGGRVFTSDGTLYKYQPEKPSNEKCVDGAGDVFAGVWSGMLSNGEDLKSCATESVEFLLDFLEGFSCRYTQYSHIGSSRSGVCACMTCGP